MVKKVKKVQKYTSRHKRQFGLKKISTGNASNGQGPKKEQGTNSNMIGITSITNELTSKKKGKHSFRAGRASLVATAKNATKTVEKAVSALGELFGGGSGGVEDSDCDQDKNKDNTIDPDEWLYVCLRKLDDGTINDQEK